MSAVTSSVSPTSRLTGYRPPSSSGRTSPIHTLRTSPRGGRCAMAPRSNPLCRRLCYRDGREPARLPTTLQPQDSASLSPWETGRSAATSPCEGMQEGADVADPAETHGRAGRLGADVNGQRAGRERGEHVLVR